MFKKSIFVTLISFAVTLLSFINQLVIANFFGANYEMDGYIIASNLPFLISAIITSSLGYSLTPFLVKHKFELNTTYPILLGSLLKKIFSISFFLYTILLVTFYLFVGNKIDFSTNKVNFIIFFFSCLISLLNILQAFFNSVFNSENNFYYPIYLSFFPFLFAFLSIIFIHKSLGSISISIGLLLGNFCSIFLSYKSLQKKLCLRSKLEKSVYNLVYSFLLKLPGVAIAMLCFSVYQTIDAFWAPALGTSNLSYLGYSQRLLIAIGSIVITGPSTILIPRLTISIEEGRKDDFFKDIILVLKLVLALSSFVAVIVSVISNEIIYMLFQRGAFNDQDTKNVAQILPYMLIGMVFMLCVVMLFRAFFTKNFKYEVILLGFLATIFYSLFSAIGSKYFGIKGITFGYILTWLLVFLISLFIIFQEDKSFLFKKSNYIFILKQLLVLFITFLVISQLKLFLTTLNFQSFFIKNLFIIFSIGSIGLALYFIFSVFIIKLDEIVFFCNRILQIIK